jgi:hypothetical protein
MLEVEKLVIAIVYSFHLPTMLEILPNNLRAIRG